MAILFPPSLRFPFGKYKGQFSEAIPSDYLEWFLANVKTKNKKLTKEIKRVLARRKKYGDPWAEPDNPPWNEQSGQEPTEQCPPPGYTGFPTPQWLIDEYPDIPRILCEWKPEDDPT